MASSSSANSSYDVFLSFRGYDVRNNFISHLHNALHCQNVKVFIDDNIDRGEDIPQFLMKIIEDAKISIIVFSSDYASSTSCLDELVKIMECKDSRQQVVFPIFYKVKTSATIYEDAFRKHRRRARTVDQEMKVKRWKLTLHKAFNVAGYTIDNNKKETTAIQAITSEVLGRLKCRSEAEMKNHSLVGKSAEDYLKIIMQCLMNDQNPRVGVWGMGGVGKTTIVKEIYNRLLREGSFSHHIYWLRVSKDSSISKLQHEIAKVISLNFFDEDNEGIRANKLSNKLERINKFVLILDDVWEDFDTEHVGIPLVGGGKLLVTTRSLSVCRRMKCQSIKVKPLVKHEALHLFVKESDSQINDFDERSKVMQRIVEECGGLPLAVVVVARKIKGAVKIHTWRHTLRELEKPRKGDNPEREEKIFGVLKRSYDHLPTDMYRQCFLYCSLFPDDHQFDRDVLIQYWIGMRLIYEEDCRQEESDTGNVILDELVDSSLLSYDSLGFIKMHDMIRDMASMNTEVGLQFEDPLKSVQVVDPNLAPHCSKLKTLVMHGHFIRELPDCIFANMQNLNVLHITSVASFNSIPASITHLGNLRLLIIIDWSNLEFIPPLVGLEKLQHLKISWNHNLKEIPEGMEKLFNLRVLDLSNNWSLSGSLPSDVVENLSHLEILDVSESCVNVEPEVLISLEKLKIMRVHFESLTKLNSYVKSGHWKRLLDYEIHHGAYVEKINECSKEKGVCLKGISDVSDIFLPNDIQNLWLVEWKRTMFSVLRNPTFTHLHTVTIYNYKSRYLFSAHLAQQLFHNVQYLNIDCCNELEILVGEEDCDINYPTIILLNLKILRLFELPELRSIYRGKMVCPSLELIQVEDCEKVKRLPFCVEKQGNKQKPSIILRGILKSGVSTSWWDSLNWEANAESMYLPIFDY